MTELNPVMNNTKWNELRLAMYALAQVTPWRCMIVNGHYSQADTEWFYHFRSGGYEDIRYVDIFASDAGHREDIRRALKAIHLPGEETKDGFRVFGHTLPGQAVDYL